MSVRSTASSRLRRGTAVGGAVLAGVMVTQVALVAPAAAVAGLVRVQITGTSDSVAKTTNANCPVGTTVIGGGGLVNGGDGQVVPNTMLPLVGGGAWSVTGREDETGFTGNWSITTTSLCAPAPVGLQAVSAFSPSSSNAKSITLPCPAGTKVLGVGGELAGGGGQLVLDDLIPSSDLSSVTVTGVEDGTGFDGNWDLTAKAVCASPPAGLVRVTSSSLTDSTRAKAATATCPTGKALHGVGAELVGAAGQVRIVGAYASTSTTAIAVGIEDEDGYAGNWTVRAYAVCAS